jgi:hypothetical protein
MRSTLRWPKHWLPTTASFLAALDAAVDAAAVRDECPDGDASDEQLAAYAAKFIREKKVVGYNIGLLRDLFPPTEQTRPLIIRSLQQDWTIADAKAKAREARMLAR